MNNPRCDTLNKNKKKKKKFAAQSSFHEQEALSHHKHEPLKNPGYMKTSTSPAFDPLLAGITQKIMSGKSSSPVVTKTSPKGQRNLPDTANRDSELSSNSSLDSSSRVDPKMKGCGSGSTKETLKKQVHKRPLTENSPEVSSVKKKKSRPIISDDSSSDSSSDSTQQTAESSSNSDESSPTKPVAHQVASKQGACTQPSVLKGVKSSKSTISVQKLTNEHPVKPLLCPPAASLKSETSAAISKPALIESSSDSSSEYESDSDSEPVSFVSTPSDPKVKKTRPSRVTKELTALKPRNIASPVDNRNGVVAHSSLNATDKGKEALGSSGLGGAEFRKQPPMCIRKMNIIEMELSFFDWKGKSIQIKKACFVRFIDDEDNEPAEEKIRNGIHYRIETEHSDGTRQCEDLYLRVVDGRDDQLVRYQGKDTSQNLQRVLITHEASCTRCRSNQSCGTRAKTPGNPVILDQKFLKFYVRCNTTCAVNHGGRVGKHNNRTFKFVFSSSPNITEKSILASSTQVNVHHNTKMKKLLDEGFNPFTREWGEPLPVV